MEETHTPQVVRRTLGGVEGRRPISPLRVVQSEEREDRFEQARERARKAKALAEKEYRLRRHGREAKRKAAREAQPPAWKRTWVAGRSESVQQIEERWRKERQAEAGPKQLGLF